MEGDSELNIINITDSTIINEDTAIHFKQIDSNEPIGHPTSCQEKDNCTSHDGPSNSFLSSQRNQKLVFAIGVNGLISGGVIVNILVSYIF